MGQTIKMRALTNKFKGYAQNRSNRSKVLFGLISLALLLLASILTAAIIQKSAPKSNVAVPQQIATVTITKDGFIPASLVVEKGTKIIWSNEDQAMHQIQSNPHPTGDSLPGLKSEILNNAQTYSYDTDRTGSFGYHDYLNPTTNGTIEIKE